MWCRNGLKALLQVYIRSPASVGFIMLADLYIQLEKGEVVVV